MEVYIATFGIGLVLVLISWMTGLLPFTIGIGILIVAIIALAIGRDFPESIRRRAYMALGALVVAVAAPIAFGAFNNWHSVQYPLNAAATIRQQRQADLDMFARKDPAAYGSLLAKTKFCNGLDQVQGEALQRRYAILLDRLARDPFDAILIGDEKILRNLVEASVERRRQCNKELEELRLAAEAARPKNIPSGGDYMIPTPFGRLSGTKLLALFGGLALILAVLSFITGRARPAGGAAAARPATAAGAPANALLTLVALLPLAVVMAIIGIMAMYGREVAWLALFGLAESPWWAFIIIGIVMFALAELMGRRGVAIALAILIGLALVPSFSIVSHEAREAAFQRQAGWLR